MGAPLVTRDVCQRNPPPSRLEKLPNELLQKIYLMSQNSFLAMTNKPLAERLGSKHLREDLVRTILQDQSSTMRTAASGPCVGCQPFPTFHLRHQFQEKHYCPHRLYRESPRTRARFVDADFALSALLCQSWFKVPESIMAINVFEWRDNNIYWQEMLIHGPWTSARAQLLWYCVSHQPPPTLRGHTTPPIRDFPIQCGILDALVEKCWPAVALLVRGWNVQEWAAWQSCFPPRRSSRSVIIKVRSDPRRTITRSKACSVDDLVPAIRHMQRADPHDHHIRKAVLEPEHVKFCVRNIEEAPALYSFTIRTAIRYSGPTVIPRVFHVVSFNRDLARRMHDIMKTCVEKFNAPQEALEDAKRAYGNLIKGKYFPFQEDDLMYLNVYDANIVQWVQV